MSMSIRTKLCLIVGLFLIPIALLSWLFIAQSRKDISFSALERQGVAELQTAWSAFETFVADARGNGAMAAADALASMTATTQRPPVSEGASGAVATLKGNGTIDEKMAGLRSFIAIIGDSSNLILDPDLDSYYLMDIAVIRMPELIEKAAFTENALVDLAPKASLTDDEKAGYVMLLGSLASADDQLTNSFAAGLTGNADGSIRTNLEAANTAFHDEVARFSATMKAAWDDLKLDSARAKVDVTAIKADYQRLVVAAKDYHRQVSVELDRLLANRISGFNFTLVTMLTISLGVTLAALVTAIFLARSIMKSINRLDFGIRRLGDTSINAEIAEANGADEIAQLARAVVYFRDRTIERLEAANSDERKRELLAGQRKALSGVAENIRGSVGKVSKAIADLALGIRATSENVATNSTKTRNDLGQAINRLATSSNDVNVVVSAVTELASSIQEISDRTARSAEETALARSRTARVASVGERLSDSSARIGEISALIAQIAQQTNLLALNATIEAARAGEAGRGFAVVASEVKQLASQTARATEEIERQVQEVRTAADDVLSAVGDMSGTVENIANLSVSIAGAVEEQSVATNEITSSLDRSVDANRHAVESLSDLPDVAANTERAAAELAQMSHMLVSETSALDQEVTRLLADLTNDNQPPSTSPLAA